MKNNLLLILFCLFYANVLQAQERIFVIDSVKSEYKLNDFTYFYADSSQKLTWQDINNKAFLPKMQVYALSSQTPKPKSKHTYWYKLKIHNRLKDQIDFTLELGNFPALEFYLLNAQNQLVRYQKTGRNVPLSERSWHFRPHVLFFKIPYQDTVTIVCKTQIQTGFSETFTDIRLVLPQILQEKQIESTKRQIFFQGAFVLMFLYNLFYFFMVRDRAYLYYALYILSMTLVASDSYAWMQEMPYFAEFIVNFTALFVTILYVQFIRYFLNIPKIQPVLNRYCDYWVYLHLAVSLTTIGVYIENPIQGLENNLIQSVFILDIVLGLWLIYKAWKNNSTLAAYMILGYLAMTLPLSAAILKQIIQGSADPETDGIMVQIGVLVELVTFSLGLGYRSKVAEKEKLQASEENRRIVAEQNVVLEQKVGERTLELNEQKQAVEERNKHIMQNINYARRIQEAFLPKEEHIRKYLADFFILFRPKDVVSGDFYFFEKIENTIIVAAIDCTGHGVSGAFMTMLGNEILHKLVDNDHITNPDLLLNELHKGVRQALKQAETENRDGMDMSLITIERNSLSSRDTISKASFAGAKNPLIYIQNKELTLLKADKMPIGGLQKEQERIFSKTIIEIIQPTTFYLFSDGFQDQFGGKEKRKFTLKRLENLFLEIHEKPLAEQKESLYQAFEKWRCEGSEKQIDDVLVLGIRV